jgi:hypothetical protein
LYDNVHGCNHLDRCGFYDIIIAFEHFEVKECSKC